MRNIELVIKIFTEYPFPHLHRQILVCRCNNKDINPYRLIPTDPFKLSFS